MSTLRLLLPRSLATRKACFLLVQFPLLLEEAQRLVCALCNKCADQVKLTITSYITRTPA